MSDKTSLMASGANVFSGRNKFINGDFKINQYNGTSSVTPASSAYISDHWYLNISQASKLTLQQVNTGSGPSALANKCLVASTLTPAATDVMLLTQYIEANYVTDLQWGQGSNAKNAYLSFWAASSLTGIFAGRVCNYAGTRSYVFTYTITSANTWQYFQIPIPADQTGTWVNYGTGGSVVVSFDYGSGSNAETTAGSWQNGNYARTSGAVKLVSNAGAYLNHTDVQFEIGETYTPFERRSYGQELALCMRYYQVLTYTVSEGICNGFAYAPSAVVGGTIYFSVPMRTTPTVSLPSVGTGAGQAIWLRGGTNLTSPPGVPAISFNGGSPTSFTIAGGGGSGLTAGETVTLWVETSATITMSAEL